MQKVTIILLGIALLVYTLKRAPNPAKPIRFPHLRGWQKIFGVLAAVATLLIILNPEFLALGLIGDTAFLEMFIFALSLQMHHQVARFFHNSVDLMSRGMRRLGTLSPGLCYLLAILMPAVAGLVTAFQKAAHRILS
jgi:hypothetical protein